MKLLNGFHLLILNHFVSKNFVFYLTIYPFLVAPSNVCICRKKGERDGCFYILLSQPGACDTLRSGTSFALWASVTCSHP